MEIATRCAKFRNVDGMDLIVIARPVAGMNSRKTTYVMMSVTMRLVTLTTVFAVIAPMAVLPRILKMMPVIRLETMYNVTMITGSADVIQDVPTLQVTLLIILEYVKIYVCTIRVDMITRVSQMAAIY